MALALTPAYKKHIRTFTPTSLADDLVNLYDKYLKLSNDCVEKGHRPLYQ